VQQKSTQRLCFFKAYHNSREESSRRIATIGSQFKKKGVRLSVYDSRMSLLLLLMLIYAFIKTSIYFINFIYIKLFYLPSNNWSFNLNWMLAIFTTFTERKCKKIFTSKLITPERCRYIAWPLAKQDVIDIGWSHIILTIRKYYLNLSLKKG
jgi:hypothetical protein